MEQNKYYVSGELDTRNGKLDLGAEIEAQNPYMAAVLFAKRHKTLSQPGAYEIEVTEVEEMEEVEHGSNQ